MEWHSDVRVYKDTLEVPSSNSQMPPCVKIQEMGVKINIKGCVSFSTDIVG